MKYIKIVFKVFIIILVSIISLFVLNYIRLNAFYVFNKSKYIEVFDVQGNTSNYVPQGLAYSEKYNVVFQTSYNNNHDVSMLYVIDFNTGNLIKTLNLKEIDGSPNINHVGGITTDDTLLWITNDYEINTFNLDEIINTNDNYITSIKNDKLPNRGDFCCYNNGILWIGDFFLNPFYKVPDNNPLLMGYNVKTIFDYSTPDYIISLPKMVQGMAVTSDNKFIFTSSFTYLINSNLTIYENVLDGNCEYYNLNNKKIPYYKFSKNNFIKNIKMPPMIEGLFNKDDQLYILFESSSDSYSFAFPKMSKVIKYCF